MAKDKYTKYDNFHLKFLPIPKINNYLKPNILLQATFEPTTKKERRKPTDKHFFTMVN